MILLTTETVWLAADFHYIGTNGKFDRDGCLLADDTTCISLVQDAPCAAR